MLTECPRCGQIHELDGGDQQNRSSAPCRMDGMIASPPPLPEAFVPKNEAPSAEADKPVEDHSREGSPREGIRTPIPWEDRRGFLDFRAYWQTTRGILLHPVQSFAQWNPPVDMEGALLFLVIFGSLGQILGNYWVRFFQASMARTAVPTDNWISFGLFILQAPFLVLISTFLSGAVTHFFLFLLRATSQRWTKTFALFAYLTGALACLQLIPFVGLVITPFWGLVASVCGLRELHGTTTWRVIAAFLLPLAIFLTLLVFFILMIVSAGLVMLHNLPWP